MKRDAVRLLDRSDRAEESGDIRETAGAEKKKAPEVRGLDGAGKGI